VKTVIALLAFTSELTCFIAIQISTCQYLYYFVCICLCL